jgi:hypothetical protein
MTIRAAAASGGDRSGTMTVRAGLAWTARPAAAIGAAR